MKKNKLKNASSLKILVFLFNLHLLLLNICIIIRKIIKKQKTYLLFKNVDNFIFSAINKGFTDISSYLNNKYYFKKKFIYKNNSSKKIIYLNCVDLYVGQNIKNWINITLANKFSFIFDTNSPDYLIYNVFGSSHLDQKYNNCVKIAYFTENIIPDLNEVDYAIGFSHINYLDRFFKHILFDDKSMYIIIRKKYILNRLKKKKFCAAVISNKDAFFRNKFISELSKYKKVDMGGNYKNNVGGSIKNKIEFLSSYKFSIAMENSEADGYTSEKIFQSFVSGTIPIYFGNYMIDEIYNPKSFILIKGEKDFYNKIEFIKKLDNNNKLYKNILKLNIFTNNINNNKKKKELNGDKKNFFLNIFNQDKNLAFRRNY